MSDGQSELCEMLTANSTRVFWYVDRMSRKYLNDADTARAKQLIHDYVMTSKNPTTEMCAVYVLSHGIPMRRWYLEKGGPLQLYYQEMKTIKVRRSTRFADSLTQTTTTTARETPPPATSETKPETPAATPAAPAAPATLDKQLVADVVCAVLTKLANNQQVLFEK